jgi:putative sterol carrier protein
MALYGSQEWLDAYKTRLNESESYKQAAAGWEGELALVIEAEPESGWTETQAGLLDLWHGECRDAKVVDEAGAGTAKFAIRAPYSRWKQVMRKELDPISGVMTGKLRLRGDMGVLMRHVAAAKELVNVATSVPTEFPDER